MKSLIPMTKRVLIDLIIFFTLAFVLRIMAGHLFLAGLNSFNVAVFVYVYLFTTLWTVLMPIRFAWYASTVIIEAISSIFDADIRLHKQKAKNS